MPLLLQLVIGEIVLLKNDDSRESLVVLKSLSCDDDDGRLLGGHLQSAEPRWYTAIRSEL